MSDMVAAGSLPAAFAAHGAADLDPGSCGAFTPPLGALRNGAGPRWRAEETQRHLGDKTHSAL